MTDRHLERVLSIAAIPELAELHPDDLASLAQRAQPGPESAHEEGALWLLLAGRVETAPPRRGFEAPALVGAVEALAGAPLSLHACAEDTRLLAISRADLDWVMADVFEVWLAMLRHTATRLVAAEPAEVDSARVQRILADRGSASRVARIRLLQACDLLEGLRVHTLGRLTFEMEELRLPAGAPLWEAGSAASQCYVAIDGPFAEVSEAGDEHLLTREPGAMLGLRRALAGLDHPRRAVAAAGARVLRFARETLIDELEDDPDTAAALLEALARRTLRAEGAREEAR